VLQNILGGGNGIIADAANVGRKSGDDLNKHD
jgi:hypothetical protein